MCACVRGRTLYVARYLALMFVVLGVAGCNDYADASLTGSAQFAAATTSSISPAGYVLRTNDQVRVQVYNEPTISGVYTIDGDGKVSVPLAGHIRAAGLTTAALERSLTQHLDGGILKDPHVSVQVATYGPVYIRGEVKQPGQFPYAPGLTVNDAVALAGGYTYRADDTKAYVRAYGSAQEIPRSLRTDVPVQPGDNIRIPERYF